MKLTFKEVEAVLAAYLQIDPERVSKLRFRLQQLQRQPLNFPEGVNVGKGGRFAYGCDQVFQLVFMFEMLDLGYPPERAKQLIGNWDMLRSGIFEAATDTGFASVYLVLHPLALNYLRQPQTDLADLSATVFHIKKTLLVDWLGAESPTRSTALIDLSGMIDALSVAVRAMQPELNLRDVISSWYAETFNGSDPQA